MDHPDLSLPSTPCSYTGDAKRLAALFAQTWWMMLCTLGLIWPSALQKRRQAIWPGIHIGDVPLVWTGDDAQQKSLESGLGRTIVALWVINQLASWAIGLKTGLILAAGTIVLRAWLRAMTQVHSYRYQLSRTHYAGLPFSLGAEPGTYARIYMLNSVIALFTLGARYGSFAVRTRRYLINNSRWGAVPARYSGTETEANKLYFLGGLASVVTLGAYFPWHIAKLRAYHAQNTSCGPLTLRVTQEGGGLSSLWFVNGLIHLCSLGFAGGYARHNTLCYQMKHLHISGALEALQQPVGGEEAKVLNDGLVDVIAFGTYEIFSA